MNFTRKIFASATVKALLKYVETTLFFQAFLCSNGIRQVEALVKQCTVGQRCFGDVHKAWETFTQVDCAQCLILICGFASIWCKHKGIRNRATIWCDNMDSSWQESNSFECKRKISGHNFFFHATSSLKTTKNKYISAKILSISTYYTQKKNQLCSLTTDI